MIINQLRISLDWKNDRINLKESKEGRIDVHLVPREEMFPSRKQACARTDKALEHERFQANCSTSGSTCMIAFEVGPARSRFRP